MKKKLEYKQVGFEVSEFKADADTGRMVIKGYASMFGNIDSYGDIVERGAFIKCLATDGARVKLCYQHDMRSVIGKIVKLEEDAKGLYMEAIISPTVQGKDVMILLEDGAIDEMSIGYRTLEYSDELQNDGGTIRRLKSVHLYEVSIVSRAANEQATITQFSKKSEQFEAELTQLTDKELTQLKTAVCAEFDNRTFNQLTK